MADVILCYASEDAAVAGRLAAAVAAQGYSLWSEDELTQGSGADITDRISPAKAAIVIWSAAAAASEWVRAEANFARGQKKLIQATIDDRPPPLPFRPADMVSIADWRGDEAHPGWRRIRAALEALCGPAPAAKSAARAPARAAASPSPPAPAGRRRGWLVAGLTLALLAAVGLGTFAWMRDLTPVARQRQAPPVAAPKEPVTPAPSAEPIATAPEADPTLLEVLPPEPPASEPEPPTRTAEAPPPRGTTEVPPPPRPTGPRISRENSQNMRLFCERAGRGTPQCRTFARQLRNARR